MRNEASKKAWANIKQTTKPASSGGATTAEVPQPDGLKLTYDSKIEVEHAFAEENSKRFGLADNVPICQGALFELLGYSADTVAA